MLACCYGTTEPAGLGDRPPFVIEGLRQAPIPPLVQVIGTSQKYIMLIFE
jgi:hypothetical protein